MPKVTSLRIRESICGVMFRNEAMALNCSNSSPPTLHTLSLISHLKYNFKLEIL